MASSRPPRSVVDFVPPHCPHPECPDHRIPEGRTYRFIRRGYQRNKRPPGWVHIFKCRTCGRHFRDASFSLDYWQKVPPLWDRIFLGLANGQAKRQIARTLGIDRGVVDRAERKIAQHCILLHREQLDRLEGTVREPVALDGFRTFAGSQYEPLDLNTTIGCTSGFFFHLQAAPLRRSGKMSERQKKIRAYREQMLGLPERGVRRRITRESLEELEKLRHPLKRIEWRTDREPDYARALADLRRRGAVKVRHRTVSSRARRDTGNPLWRVNLLHLLMRHSLKSHGRETIGFHKILRGVIDRAVILRTWLNQVKGISERDTGGQHTTPSMILGLERRAKKPEQLFRRRLFREHFELTEEESRQYAGSLKARPREGLQLAEPRV
ncbi:MAG: hypothetical protein ACE5EF_13600 [Dehalococcoidia bacterium]